MSTELVSLYRDPNTIPNTVKLIIRGTYWTVDGASSLLSELREKLEQAMALEDHINAPSTITGTGDPQTNVGISGSFVNPDIIHPSNEERN